MSSGQTMLSAAFFVLVTVAVLNANRMMIDSASSYYELVAVEQGTGAAGALLQEILTKKFDSQADYSHYQMPWEFDSPASLGPGAAAKAYINPWPDVSPFKSIKGINGNFYDDVDDYNGYERTVNTSDIKGYHLKVSVYYVTKGAPNTPYWTESYFKRVDVTIDHPVYLTRKITVSGMASY
ncbi:MAG: hypothetical protein NTV54_04200 [Ignavibacteriales bacterium]|nr:hypothetical protein [Ignavibacteriales bacterium]